MDRKEMEERVIESYKSDEKMMILVYAQWCINNGIDPVNLYGKAYPDQLKNQALVEAMELTVPKEESEEIPNQTVLNVLQLFGNDDLAFLVQEQIDQQKR
ncbi:hypothetical protein [Oceanobacillus limi]|nr:hypothetical protein [Oceanobacillus limi]